MNVLILGATSIVGQKLAHVYAAAGHHIILAGRNLEETQAIAGDVSIRNEALTAAYQFDAMSTETHPSLIEKIENEVGVIDTAILVFGDMGDSDGDYSFGNLKQIVAVNYLGAASLSEVLAERMSDRGQGSIIGISSVAGDRGRQKNYHYGSAKGAFTLFLQGLRNRLHRHGVHVMTVRLGFVDTRLTYGQKSPLPSADPMTIAKAIFKAEQSRSQDIYLPRFWGGVMTLIKAIPEFYFKRLDI